MRLLVTMFLAVLVAGCSYEYEVTALVIDGHLAFDADPRSGIFSDDCVREISIVRDDDSEVAAEHGDDESRTGYGTVWFQIIEHVDGCANTFPIVYGEAFKGRFDSNWPPVRSKPLQRGVVYNVWTTTGSTGYGAGRFTIDAEGRIVNLAR